MFEDLFNGKNNVLTRNAFLSFSFVFFCCKNYIIRRYKTNFASNAVILNAVCIIDNVTSCLNICDDKACLR